MAADRAEKCAHCHRYVRAEGSELCLPCINAAAMPTGVAPASCADCVGEYFAGMSKEPAARRFRDPLCPRATPWCALYEGVLERIKWAGEVGLAQSLDRMRKTMKRQLEGRA